MPTTRPRVPGWHPDPDDPGSLRHWNGKRWGDERRPRPSWAPGPHVAGVGAGGTAGSPGQSGSGPGGSRRRWYLLAAAVLAIGLFFITAPAWIGAGTPIPPRTVTDTTFTRRAEAACAKALPPLRNARPIPHEDTGTKAAFARRIDRAAAGLEKVTTTLRAIPVAAADGTRVGGWLDDWSLFTDVGHRYAAAVRTGDDPLSATLSRQGQDISKRVFVFAKSNDMPSCIFP